MGSPMKERRPGRRVSKAKSSVGGGEAGGRGMEGKGEGEEERMDEVGEKLRVRMEGESLPFCSLAPRSTSLIFSGRFSRRALLI
jgi:hypothetical protein